MGIGNGRRQHFTGRHITGPAEAERIMSSEGFGEDIPAKENDCSRKSRILWTCWFQCWINSIRIGWIDQMSYSVK